MADYKLLKELSTDETIVVFRKSDSRYIPFDEENTDYQEYLEWVAKGNTPEEAD